MSKHSIVKAGLGVGLMAASLGAMAQLHTFAEPSIYYKLNGGAVNYIAFVPNNTAGVVFLDLYNSGTVSSWAYGIGNLPDAAAGGVVWSVNVSGPSNSSIPLSFATYDAYGVAGGQTLAATGASFSINSTWYGGGTAALSMAFIQPTTISSQACNVSFVASMGTDDYLQFPSANFTIAPVGFPTISAGSAIYRISSGTSTSNTSGIAFGDWNALSAAYKATTSLPTFSAISSGTDAAAAVAVLANSAFTKFNLCTGALTKRTALNDAGGSIGAKAGMMRLW